MNEKKYLLGELEKWKGEGLVDERSYSTLKDRYTTLHEEDEKRFSSSFKLEVLSGGGVAILIIAIILLMIFLDMSPIWYGHIFMVVALVAMGVALVLWKFTGLKYLATGMFILYLVMLEVAFFTYWSSGMEYDDSRPHLQFYAFPMIIAPVIGLVVAFIQRSKAILMVSWVLVYAGLFVGFMLALRSESEHFGILGTFICTAIMVSALLTRKFIKVHKDWVWHVRLTYIIMVPFFILPLFLLPVFHSWVWEKALLLLLLSAPLLVWSLIDDDRPLAVVALLVLIGNAFFFGIAQGQIIGAGIALFITAALLIGFAVFFGLKSKMKKESSATEE